MTVMHGTADLLDPVALAERLADLTGGRLILVDGGSHGLLARDPVRVNHAIREFVERCVPVPVTRRWTPARIRPRRVLYLSSPIGLGHARRDAAVADELRRLHPDLQVDWLTQHPVTRFLEDRGEHVHPASRALSSESGHVEHEAGEHDLHVFQAVRTMDEILVNNFHVFADLVETEHYDLVVGDEAWDVDHFLHENPELKRFPFAWMTDFVGWLPMPDGGPAETALTADHNAQMLEQRARFRHIRDSSLFVGNPGDIVAGTFGPGLPTVRRWTEDNYEFTGYITDLDPAAMGGTELLRRRLGVAAGGRLCVVSVGGSGVGGALLRRVLDAVPLARRTVPELHVVVVAGPRIDPDSLPRPPGVTVLGYVPDLPPLLAACDVAVVQGGLSTCMELTALRKPFVYVPLQHHFEQNIHVRHRLDRYGAGRHLAYADAVDPSMLAEVLVGELLREDVAYQPVETGGAARAAALLGQLL